MIHLEKLNGTLFSIPVSVGKHLQLLKNYNYTKIKHRNLPR